jgi:hypothetical protein
MSRRRKPRVWPLAFRTPMGRRRSGAGRWGGGASDGGVEGHGKTRWQALSERHVKPRAAVEVSVCEGGGACRKRTNGKMVFLPMLCLAEATWLPLESCNSRLLIPSCHGMEQCNRGFSITFLLFLPLIRHLLIPMEIYADILK